MTLARLTDKMFPSIPSFADNFFGRDLMDWSNWNFAGADSTLPAVNVKETNDYYLIEVAAPGMNKGDFKLNYDNGRLTISSEKSDEREEKDGEKVTRREFCYQTFRRTFNVPQDAVVADKISAKYKDGILHVTLPKQEAIKAKPAKQIKVS